MYYSSRTFTVRASGFTLIEIMMVVVIIAILVAIALPSYNKQTLKTHRSDAEAALASFAGAMEKEFTSNGSYAGADGNSSDITAAVAPTIFYTQVPASGTAYYKLYVTQADASTYTIQARPTGSQAGDGRLEITNTGKRCWYQGQDSSGGTCTSF